MAPLSRGHVVALRRNGVGIVWHASATEAWIVPIWGTNGPPRHRAEVVIDDIGEIVACGISYRYPVARCHMAFKVRDRGAFKVGASRHSSNRPPRAGDPSRQIRSPHQIDGRPPPVRQDE
jgi:hypothetical protein